MRKRREGNADAGCERFLGNSENAVKTQIWCAVCNYVLIAIVKKTLQLDASLNTLLQFLSISAFEKTQLSCALQPDLEIQEMSLDANQLDWFTFNGTLLVLNRLDVTVRTVLFKDQLITLVGYLSIQ